MTTNAQSQRTGSLFRNSKAFTSYSVTDLKKAREFYGQTLGLEVAETGEGLSIKLADGHNVFLYPKPNHTPASFTVLNFSVDSVEEAANELKNLGIALEHYDLPDLKTDEDGIFRGHGPTIAWFKDPDGNILSVFKEPRSSTKGN